MAGCDYYSCDRCGWKTFYDASVDWEAYEPMIGKILCICKDCAKEFDIVMIEKPTEAKDKE